MSTRTLDAAPTWGALARAQLRMLVLLQRRDFLVLGGILVVLLGLAIWGLTQMPGESTSRNPQSLGIFPPLAIPLALIGAAWPLGVWRKDSPERRGYFWSLPVARGPHTLLRAGTGWLLLLGVCLVVMAFAVLVVSPMVLRFDEVTFDFAGWWIPLATATLAYLLMSAMAVFFDSPVRWLAWTWLAVFATMLVADQVDLNGLERRIAAIVRSFGSAVSGLGPPSFDDPVLSWGVNYAIWFAIGAVALVLAAFRFQDAR